MKSFKTFITAFVLGATVLTIFALASPNQACASPNFDRQEVLIYEVTLGDSTFRLSTDNPSVPFTDGYSYLVEITPGANLISVNLHIQLSHELDGDPFHYLGDAIYIEHNLEDGPEEEQDDNADFDTTYDNQNENVEPEIVRHILQPRAGTSLSGIGITEGVYHVAVTVTATTDEGFESATLRDLLVVYNPEKPQLNLMPTIHLSALPLRCGEGIFIKNPAGSLFEERRKALEAISAWIYSNPQAHLTLAVSPLFLSELNSVAQGEAYFYAQNDNDSGNGNGNNGSNSNNGNDVNGDNGTTTNNDVDASGNDNASNYNAAANARHIPADTPIAQSSERTLAALQNAHNTGRLHLSTQGYADPNPAVLNALGLPRDIGLQYTEGISVLRDVLDIEIKNISVPWTEHLCIEYFSILDDILPQATIIVDSNTRGFDSHLRDGQQSTPLLRVPQSAEAGGGSEIIVSHAGLSSSLSSPGNKARSIAQLLEQRQETRLTPLLVRSYDDAETVLEFLDNLELLTRYSWVNVINSETRTADTEAGIVTFDDFETMQTIPSATQELQLARVALQGVERALHEPSEETLEELSHWKQVSLASFAGPSIGVSTIGNELLIAPPAAECANLAAQVYSYVQSWFSDLEIHAQTITFSGSGGMLPITIQNNSDQSFYLDVRYVGPGHNVVIEPERTHQLFPPGETFLEPSIELRNIVSGSVDIQLWAGGHLIAGESVRVSATYADRIAIIVVVALAGTGLAFYVWRRVSSNSIQENDQEELG